MDSSPPHDELWDVDRLAAHLGVGRRYVYLITQQRRIEHLRIGNSLRFTSKAVEAFLESRTVLARKPPLPARSGDDSDGAPRRPGRPRRGGADRARPPS